MYSVCRYVLCRNMKRFNRKATMATSTRHYGATLLKSIEFVCGWFARKRRDDTKENQIMLRGSCWTMRFWTICTPQPRFALEIVKLLGPSKSLLDLFLKSNKQDLKFAVCFPQTWCWRNLSKLARWWISWQFFLSRIHNTFDMKASWYHFTRNIQILDTMEGVPHSWHPFFAVTPSSRKCQSAFRSVSPKKLGDPQQTQNSFRSYIRLCSLEATLLTYSFGTHK